MTNPLRLVPAFATALLLAATGSLGSATLSPDALAPAPAVVVHRDAFLAAGPEPLAPEDCIETSPGDSVPGIIACGIRSPCA